MRTLVYDGSFGGWLSAVFDVYEYKFASVTICPEHHRQDKLFGETHTVHTERTKSERVWKGLEKYLPAQGRQKLYKTFLSEQRGMEDMLLEYVQYVFREKKDITKDYGHRAVSYITDTAKKVHREKHRMEAFVRFQKTGDDLYFSIVEPDFNVLPLIATHFEKRYADQRWLIYDKKRKYGIHYDLKVTSFVQIDIATGAGDTELGNILNESEHAYQQLWRDYFHSTNIKARKNMKLHIRHMPLRYWKYLTEKHPEL
jgi:probable DNA metabolism protein